MSGLNYAPGDPAGDLVDGGYVTQQYGCTDAQEWPDLNCPSRFHHVGIDIGGKTQPLAISTPVRTPRDGTVVRIGIPYLGPGAVGIRFDDGRFGIFGHGDNWVAVGERVRARQNVMGVNTHGASSGPHVHFAVRTDRADETGEFQFYVDPRPYLTFPPEAAGAGNMESILVMGGQVLRAFRGTDGAAWIAWKATGQRAWQGERSLGGKVGFSIAIYDDAGTPVVEVGGTDHRFWESRRTAPGQWTQWALVPGSLVG